MYPALFAFHFFFDNGDEVEPKKDNRTDITDGKCKHHEGIEARLESICAPRLIGI